MRLGFHGDGHLPITSPKKKKKKKLYQAAATLNIDINAQMYGAFAAFAQTRRLCWFYFLAPYEEGDLEKNSSKFQPGSPFHPLLLCKKRNASVRVE